MYTEETVASNPVNGFDFFAIEHGVVFGGFFEGGIVMEAAYDSQAFADAHIAFDYEQTTIEEISAWCPVTGCDSALEPNFDLQNSGHLFDSHGQGIKPPILVTEDYFASATTMNLNQAMANTANDESGSIMDAPDYSAILAAVTDAERYTGDLIQLIYQRIAPQETSDDLSVPHRADYGALPAHQMFAFADRQEGDEQVAILAVLYSSREDAEIASAELEHRLRVFSYSSVSDSIMPLIDVTPSAVLNAHIFEQDDLYVVVGEIRHILPPETAEVILSENFDDVNFEEPLFQGYFIRQWYSAKINNLFDVLWNISVTQ